MLMRFKQSKGFCGFSLVELLITLLLGSTLLVMVIGLYVSSVSEGGKALKYSRLRSDLQSLISMIETDIRRAGYGGDAYLVGEFANKSIDINSAQNCIIYYYNHNHTTSLEHSNKMAFSLKKGALKFKAGIGQVADAVCQNEKGWTSISDVQFMTVNQLRFTENITSNAHATLRSIKIELAGSLLSNNIYSHSISTHVQVRNREFYYAK